MSEKIPNQYRIAELWEATKDYVNEHAVESDGLYGFEVNEEGHLIYSYTGDNPPDFSIEDGHLYVDIPPKLDLGNVVGPQGPAGPDGIPKGGIIIWSGMESNIPEGWHLCDGTNGTPDLRDRFVLGAGNKYSVDETGGSEEVTLTVEQMPRHDHRIISAVGNEKTGARRFPIEYKTDDIPTTTVGTNVTGSSQPHPNMPPYYALCYIMKL